MKATTYKAKNRVGEWVSGYLVVNPLGVPFIIHYKHMAPCWSQVDPQTVEPDKNVEL